MTRGLSNASSMGSRLGYRPHTLTGKFVRHLSADPRRLEMACPRNLTTAYPPYARPEKLTRKTV